MKMIVKNGQVESVLTNGAKVNERQLGDYREAVNQLMKEYKPVVEFATSRHPGLIDQLNLMVYRNSDSDAEVYFKKIEAMHEIGKEGNDKILEALEGYKEMLTMQHPCLRRMYLRANDKERLDMLKELIRRDSPGGQMMLEIVNEYRNSRAARKAERIALGKSTRGLKVNDQFRAILSDLYRTNLYTSRSFEQITDTAKDTVRAWIIEPGTNRCNDKRATTSKKTTSNNAGMKSGLILGLIDFEKCSIEVYRSVKANK